jgi:hypothetical protein
MVFDWRATLLSHVRLLVIFCAAGAVVGVAAGWVTPRIVRATVFVELPRLPSGLVIPPEEYVASAAPASSAAAGALRGKLTPAEFVSSYTLVPESTGLSIRVQNPDRATALEVLSAVQTFVMKDLQAMYRRATESLDDFEALLHEQIGDLSREPLAPAVPKGHQAAGPIDKLAGEAVRYNALMYYQQLYSLQVSAARARPPRAGAVLVSEPQAGRRLTAFAVGGGAVALFTACALLLLRAYLRSSPDGS